jgi:hypothetical protein
MPKLISFQIPTVDGPRDAQGYRVWLRIGQTVRPFMLQLRGEDPCNLTDFASGYKLYDMANDRLAYRVNSGTIGDGPTPFTTWRRMAQHWLAQKTNMHGEAPLLAKFDAVPVINRV